VRDIPIFGDRPSVPGHVGGLELDEIQTWRDRRLGASFGYSGDDVKARAYLYNLGLTNIPTDLRSGEVQAFFKQAYMDILRVAKRGNYQNLELSEPQLLYLPDDAEPFCLWAKFGYRHTPESGVGFTGPCASHLALRTDGGFINKVRYTYPVTDEGENAGSKSLLAFMVEWTVFVQAFGSRDETEPVLVSVGPGPQRPS
jgi:hypothetical protein